MKKDVIYFYEGSFNGSFQDIHHISNFFTILHIHKN